MKDIVIAINQEFVEKILNGTKKYEFRTKVARQDVGHLIIYCTYPTKKIVAKVKIKKIVSGTPDDLWEKTAAYSGISREFFNAYFQNRETAFAYELGEIIRYKKPLDLIDFGLKSAPQSFVYSRAQ